MSLTLFASPGPVVADSEAAHYLRLDEAQFDVLTILIGAASAYVAADLGRALIAQTYDLALDDFPRTYDGYRRVPSPIALAPPPVTTVTHVKYIDESGALQTWATPTGYVVDAPRGYIYPAYGVEYPTTRDVPNAVTVRFVTGPADALPEHKDLVLQRVAYYHENREAMAEDASNTHRVWSVG